MLSIHVILRRRLLFFYIKYIKYILLFLAEKVFGLILIKQRWKDELYYNFINNHKIIEVKNSSQTFKFYSLSLMSKKRYDTMFTKEEDTIEWIDNFENNKTFWDIGSNVGIYSIYYAKKNINNQVISFEPSVFNLEILARNIFLNKTTKNITLIPLCINSHNKIDTFNMNNTTYGGALSGFGVEYDEYFQKREINFQYKTISMSLDKIKHIYSLNCPNYIKIDVDGIENLILDGSNELLKNNQLLSILVENPTNSEKINAIMTQNNFILKTSKGNNQIWDRKA